MTLEVITTETGYPVPPAGPHTITVQVRGWDEALKFRDRDPSLLQKIRSIYPRFMPFGAAKELSIAIHQKVSLPPTHGCLPFTHPDIFSMARDFAFSHHRQEPKLVPGDLIFKVVDIAGARLYCIGFPLAKAPGIIGVWQNPGTGVSTRLAEHLLKQADTLVEVPFDAAGDAAGDAGFEKVPTATYLPETVAHQGLRERIAGLLKRAPVTPQTKSVGGDDIYFYPTGMAAIYRVHHAVMQVPNQSAPMVALGALFQSTYRLFLECAEGFKHFGQCDNQSNVPDKLEAHLKSNGKVSYVFVEFPSNPILVSVDLKKLRQLADQYKFILVVDETVGSFSNLDVLSVADVIITSLTKSFSGYADVMGGSIILNPSSPFYPALKKVYQETFHNEYFAGDAEKLLANSANYLPRSAILNRNAAVVAALLQTHAARPNTPILKVLYPSLSDTAANYEAFMRPATADFTPGYGCLLSIDFPTIRVARAFYDNLQVHQGPHLGAHRTLAMCFNELAWGKDEEEFKYHIAYGSRREQVRVSVGLEEVGELTEVFEEAVRWAEAAMKEEA